jgi:hypothetical protein
MRVFAMIACGYVLIGLLISMLMDRFKKLEPRILLLGVLFWPLAFPVAVIAGIREIRKRR